MGLETTTTIAGLVSTDPAGGDPVSQGDDHIKLLKAVLKNIFPGSGGVGFSTPITATEAELNVLASSGVSNADLVKLAAITSSYTELNQLDGRTLSSTNAILDNFEGTADGGGNPTVMLFHQTTAPTGWTKGTSFNDHALRIVTGTVSNSSAGQAFSTVHGITATDGANSNNVVSHTHGVGTLTMDDPGDHTHAVKAWSNAGGSPNVSLAGDPSYPSDISGAALAAGAHTHTLSGSTGTPSVSGSTHAHGINLAIDYVDIIRATKD